jgi:mannose-6-phosphate isomerase-like protein (cupin superfamily)
MRGTIPPGVSVPLHSHAEPETFVMLSGTVEGLVCRHEDFEWIEIHPGDVFHVPPHARHAWRNHGSTEAAMLLISTPKLGRFLQELGRPHRPGSAAPPLSAEEVQRLQQTSARYDYWNATAEENAQVGIRMPSNAS